MRGNLPAMTDTPRRRLNLRFLTLAEIVGVAALVIAGLGYWDSHRERTQQDAQRAAADRDRAAQTREQQKERQAEAEAAALKLTFLITGTPDAAGERIRLSTVHPEQVIQTQTVWFPTMIRPDSVETTGNPRIEAGWLQDGLRRAAGGQTHGRAPVAIQTVFIEDGQVRTDRSLYLLGYSLHPRLIGGAKVELEGLSLARRDAGGDLQAAVDDLWSKR
jgi:hypothetical protein